MNDKILVTKNNIVELLFNRIKEFADTYDYSVDFRDLDYVVFGEFASFLIEKIESSAATDKLIKEAIHLFDDMALSNDLDVQNILVASIFERLTDSDQCIELFKRKLSGKALDYFEETVKTWR